VLDAMVEVAAYVLRSLSAPEARDLTLSIVPVLGKVVRDSQDRFSLPKWQAARGDLKRHQAVAELEHLEAHGFVQRSPGDIVRYTPLWHSVKIVTAPPEPIFPPLVCVRALADEDKGEALREGVRGGDNRRVFVCDPDSFRRIPGSPFAYWVGATFHRLFAELPPFESEDRMARQGGATSDDFRYLRAFWECSGRPLFGTWRTYVKGGAYSPFYNDLPLVADWHDERQTFAGFFGRPGRSSEKPSNYELYFRPGITWPLRAKAFSPQVMPADSIFTVRGYAILAPAPQLLPLLGLSAASVFDYIFKILLGRFGFPEFVVGVLQKLPIPNIANQDGTRLGQLSHQAWTEKRGLKVADSTSHAFIFPALLAGPGNTLADRAAAWAARVRTSEETVAAIQAEINDLAFRLYGLDAADREALTSTLATEATSVDESESSEEEAEEAATADATTLAADLLAYGLGVALGRWDIRYATGERVAPESPDPFARLPVCPPGQLQNAQGLPASSEDVPASYPLKRIPWAGILVDDESHQCDLVSSVRDVIEIIWTGSASSPSAEAIEQEACEILGVKSLRDYFRKPAGFFADHLKRYSKSRRQAPIYWPLSTASGSYTLWIYYHRLTDQTLFQCVNDFVKPKITEVEGDLSRLTTAGTDKPGARAEIERLTLLRAELVEFRDELLRVAQLPYRPNLNDGVLITASPLWKLFRLPKWQKDLKACWTALENEEYEWAHLAHTLWPDRVKAVCKKDRSIAIAHGLEELCEVRAPEKKAKKGKKKADTELTLAQD